MRSPRAGSDSALTKVVGGAPTVDRQTREFEGREGVASEVVAERFRRLVEGWMAEDPAYDQEAWPEFKEALDRNRPEYRKHFFPKGSALRV